MSISHLKSQTSFQKMSFDAVFSYMKDMLSSLYPEGELAIKAEQVVAIERLKQERGAVILGHNYMEPALFHTVADICGDSLKLARVGAQSSAKTLVVCGVRFMAETAKILSPQKTVLLPAKEAGCSLASSITAQDVVALKKLYPQAPVVSYVNTYADIKAESDICCTSSNAVAIVKSLDADIVIFIPDRYLAANVARETGKSLIVPENTSQGLHVEVLSGSGKDVRAGQMVSWPGACEVHEKFSVEDIEAVRLQFGNDVVVLAHPECPADVCEAADASGSTSYMIDYVKNTQASRYLLLTECAMADNIVAENPKKEMLRMCSHRCPHMASITLDMTLHALENYEIEIALEQDIQRQAYKALDRMLAFG